MINIGKCRECFFDDYIIDTMHTTAETRVHNPIRRELVIKHDAPWEGCGCDFHNFFYDEEYGKYRLYYLGWKLKDDATGSDGIRACYMESRDGIHWEKPNLGLVEYNGSKDNNILLNSQMHPRLDNFMVFKDTNPECKKGEEYKCVLRAEKIVDGNGKACLKCLFSSDGIHFNDGYEITDHGAFDSLNVAFWDEVAKVYRCYFRSNHKVGDRNTDAGMGLEVRDIRYMESKDFKNWSEPRLLDFGNTEDIPLYTNVCQNYYRAPQYVIGFPSRYIERKAWTKNYDELCGKEKRQKRMKGGEPRYGLTVTDCIFMASRDGLNFTKYDEAFMTPGPEFPENWVYGDCYPFRGMLETPSDIPGAEPEISMFAFNNHWMGLDYATDVYRYTIRRDGFVSRHAGATEKLLVTKPFVYDGKSMYANLSTSARGYMYFTVKSKDGETIESCEMFGDSTDKKIGFCDGDIEKLSGREVVLEIRMMDADIYSFRFE